MESPCWACTLVVRPRVQRAPPAARTERLRPVLRGVFTNEDVVKTPTGVVRTCPRGLKATGRGLKATGRGRKLTLTRFFVQAFFQFHGRLRGALPRALPLRVRARSPSLEAVAVLALTYPTHCRAFAGRRLWSSSLTTRARRPAADNILSMARCLWS